MPGRFLARLREWIIVIVALCVIVPLFYVASLPSQQSQPASVSPNTAQNSPASPERTATTPAAAPVAATKQASPQPSSPSAAPSNQAAALQAQTQPATPAAHDHAAPAQVQTPSQQAQAPSSAGTSGQAPQPAANAAMNVKGDVAAGRQVFRKCQACHSLEPGKTLVGPSASPASSAQSRPAMPNYSLFTGDEERELTWRREDARCAISPIRRRSCPATRCRSRVLRRSTTAPTSSPYLAAIRRQRSRSGASAATTARTGASSAIGSTAAQQRNRAYQRAAAGAQFARLHAGRALHVALRHRRRAAWSIIGVGGAIDGKVNPV